jgi:hypothetical protein
MSIEVIPEPFRQPFDPLGNVDHDLVRLYTQGRIMSGRGVRNELQRVFSTNRFHSRELIERLINYGKFLEPYDDELEAMDETYMRTRVFNAGVALALATTANMAFELDIDQFEWRRHWIKLPADVDAPMKITIDKTSSSEDCYKIGAAIISIGQRNLSELEDPYVQMLSELEGEYETAGAFNNIFQSSYGYVFGVGRNVLREVIYPEAIESEVLSAMPDVFEPATSGPLDDEYKTLLAAELGGENV